MTSRPDSKVGRRFFLRSATAAVAIPCLPSMTRGQTNEAPKRFIALVIPSGVAQGGRLHGRDHWSAGEGFSRLDDPTHHLHELREFKSELIQVRNTRCQGFFHGTRELGLAPAIGHVAEQGYYLTGSTVKPNGQDIGWTELNINDASIDQKIASLTNQRPLNLGVMPRRDPPPAHSVSWLNGRQADPWMNDPTEVYAWIFGSAEQAANQERFRRLIELRRSVLDGISAERLRLEDRISREDRHHLDAYFTNVRETEMRIAETRDVSSCGNIPDGSLYDSEDLTANAGLVTDLAIIALECDITRVVTMSCWGSGGGTGGNVVGSYVPGLRSPNRDYHYYTHFATPSGGFEEDRYQDFMTVSRWAAGHFAKFVRELSARTDRDGNSMFENSLVMYGSSMGDAPNHGYIDVARVFAGRLGGLVSTGRILDGDDRPVDNLLPEILSLFGYLGPDGNEQSIVGLSDGRLSLR